MPLARAVKQATRMPVVAVGLITGFEQAEAIVSTGDADFVALARGILYDPRWPWHAAAYLERVSEHPNSTSDRSLTGIACYSKRKRSQRR